jgi:hypothetical protein
MRDDLESEKLQLERDKLRFEREKFEADAARREEELLKLAAERQKTHLEAEDFRVPYKDRPAYKTAVFQGTALIIGVIAALANFGVLVTLFDAKKNQVDAEAHLAQSKRETDDLTKEKEGLQVDISRAREDKKAAERDKASADENIRSTYSSLDELQGRLDAQNKSLAAAKLEAEKSRTNAVLAPLKEILDNLENASKVTLYDSPNSTYEMRPHTIDSQNNHADETNLYSMDSQKKRLEAFLASTDSGMLGERLSYLEGFTLSEKVTRIARLAVLEVLLKIARDRGDYSKTASYSWQYEGLATSEADPYIQVAVWARLQRFADPDRTAGLICSEYDRAVSISKLPPHDKRKLAVFIFDSYFLIPECQTAVMDVVDTQFLPLPDETIRNTVPWELLSFQYLAAFERKAEDDARELKYEMNVALTRHVGISDQAPVPMQARYLDSSNDYFNAAIPWAKQNRELMEIMSESGLHRLRTCKPILIERLMQGNWIDMKDIKEDCPMASWK